VTIPSPDVPTWYRTCTLVCVLVLSLAGAIACRPQPADRPASPGTAATPAAMEEIEAALMEADREFARRTAERGIDGWMEAFASDAARVELHGAVVRGLEAIREHDAPIFTDPALRLNWEPKTAGAFGPGDIGFTTGSYEVTRSIGGAPPAAVSRGSYLTIWRRRDGRWEVLLDGGAPAPQR